MPRYIAFLRAINVGGHVVRMNVLRELFEELGFSDVSTFIASGQVIFHTRAAAKGKLETRIEKHLRAALGYDVATFIRTPAQLADIVRRARPVDGTLYIAFTRAAPSAAAQKTLASYNNDVDSFEVYGSEVYWYARRNLSGSTFSGAMLEKVIGMPATLRNLNTVQRLLQKYGD